LVETLAAANSLTPSHEEAMNAAVPGDELEVVKALQIRTLWLKLAVCRQVKPESAEV
jgi:hypothetical protein